MYNSDLLNKIEEGRKLKEAVQSRKGNDQTAEDIIKKNEQKKLQSSDYQTQIIDKIIHSARSYNIEQDGNSPNSLANLVKKIDHINHFSANGELPIIAAVESNFNGNVKFFIQNGALLDLKDKRGKTALMRAVELSKIHIIDELISAGANKNIADSYGNSLIHLAVYSKNIESLLKVISLISNINIQNNNGDTALHLATAIGDIDVLRYLLSQSAINTMIYNNHGYLPVHNAVINGHINILDELTKNVYTVDTVSKDNKTLLTCAVIFNQAEMIEKLISMRANPKILDTSNKGPLQYAIDSKNTNLIKVLQEYIIAEEAMEAKNLAMPNQKSFYSLHEINFLLKYLFKFEEVIDKILVMNQDGTTILHLVAAHGYYDLLELLLEQPTIKQYINKQDDAGNTIISAALLGMQYLAKYDNQNIKINDNNITTGDRIKVIKLLLNSGIDLKIQNNSYEVPILVAIATNNLLAMKEIISFDSSQLSYKNKDQMSLLHYATYMIRPAIIESLIQDYKFNIHSVDSYHRNILDLANIMLKSAQFADHSNVLRKIIKYYIDLGLMHNETSDGHLQQGYFYLNQAISNNDIESLTLFKNTHYNPGEAAKIGDIKALEAYIKYGYNYQDEAERKNIIASFEHLNMQDLLEKIYPNYSKDHLVGEICISDQ